MNGFQITYFETGGIYDKKYYTNGIQEGIWEKYHPNGKPHLKAFLVKGSLTEILDEIHQKGFKNLYIDGGTTIQNFLKEDLIDEMILTKIPIWKIIMKKGLNFFRSPENEEMPLW